MYTLLENYLSVENLSVVVTLGGNLCNKKSLERKVSKCFTIGMNVFQNMEVIFNL